METEECNASERETEQTTNVCKINMNYCQLDYHCFNN